MARVYMSAGRRRRKRALLLAVVLTGVAAFLLVRAWIPSVPTATVTAAAPRVAGVPLAWPPAGTAALAVGNGEILTSGATTAAPIASLAKVMTAMVVLRSHPLSDGDDGFRLTITSADVADTSRRREQGQSVVAVAAGEQLSERQALYALMLPSANNIALSLARAVSGSPDAFVDQMNQEARRLGMDDTSYTDPSGFEPSTVSTAHDQVVLGRAAMRISAFRDIVGRRTATLPVAGVVTNTNALAGRDGFLGIKTGSDQAAGGCYLFARRSGHGRAATILYGVVLGQRHGPLIAAGLDAGRRLATSAAAALVRSGQE